MRWKRWLGKYKGRRIFRNMFFASFSLAALCIFLAVLLGSWYFSEGEKQKGFADNENKAYTSTLRLQEYIGTMCEVMTVLRNDIYMKQELVRTEDVWDRNTFIAAKQIYNLVQVDDSLHSIYAFHNEAYMLKAANYSYPLNPEADSRMQQIFYESEFGVIEAHSYTDLYGEKVNLLCLSEGEIDPVNGEKENGILVSLDIGDVMETFRSENGERDLLIDSKGSIVYDLGGEFMNGDSLPEELEAFLDQCMTEGQKGYSDMGKLLDQKYLMTGMPVEDNLYLLHLMPYEEVMETVKSVVLLFCLIGLSAECVILLTALFMSRWAYSPIDAIVRSTQKEERTEKDVSQLERTELASIAQTYKTMVETLNHLHFEQEQKELATFLSEKGKKGKEPKWMEELYGKEGFHCVVLCFRISDLGDLYENNTEEAIDFELQTIRSVSEQVMSKEGEVQLCPIDREYFAVLFFTETRILPESLEKMVMEIIAVARKLLHIEMNVGVSEERNSLQELPEGYQMARASTAYRFLYGVNTMITEKMMVEKALCSARKITLDEAMECLKRCDRKGFRRCYEELEKRARLCSIQTAKDTLLDLIVKMRRYQNELQHQPVEMTKGIYEQLCAELDRYVYISDAAPWFWEEAEKIWRLLEKAKENGKEDIIEKAIDYLQGNYSDQNMCAQYVADLLHITPSYFSRLFNERCGCAFPDYLSTLRIEKACELLLKDETMSIKTICETVGYSNSSYFIASFKKRYGITPGQYRKNNGKREKNHIGPKI